MRVMAVVFLGVLVGCADDSGSSFQSERSDWPSEEPAPGPRNVSFGGSQDVGDLRVRILAGDIPPPEDFDDAGFFAEHYIERPTPRCDEPLCLFTRLGLMANLVDGRPCALVELGVTVQPGARTAHEPKDWVITVDVSGSMADGGKLDGLQRGLRQMLDTLHDDDRMALVTYSDDGEVAVPLVAMGNGRPALGAAIDALRTRGGTNIAAGLRRAADVVAEADRARPHVVLLSDGLPTQGPTDPESLVILGQRLHDLGAVLSTVGAGRDYDRDLLLQLALAGGGQTWFAEDAAAVEEIFAQELAASARPVAADVSLTVTAAEGLRFGAAYGSPRWSRVAGGATLTVPWVFEAERTSDTDQTPAGGRRGGGSSLIVELAPQRDEQTRGVAAVELSYRLPDEAEARVVRGVVAAPAGVPLQPPEGFFESAPAAKAFVMLNVFVGLRDACAAFREGEPGRGWAALQALDFALADYLDDAPDADLAADRDLVRALLRNFEDSGNGGESAEPPRDPWPVD